MSDPNDTPEDQIKLPLVEQIIQTAREQIGKPYKLGAEGPLQFDCSGLIWYIFKQNNAEALIGGARHRANWYYHYFDNLGQFDVGLIHAQRGDLIVYGHERATHIGIFLGRRRVISALINPWGVTRTLARGIEIPIIGTCHVAYPGREI